jgi:hypothetical protein
MRQTTIRSIDLSGEQDNSESTVNFDFDRAASSVELVRHKAVARRGSESHSKRNHNQKSFRLFRSLFDANPFEFTANRSSQISSL